MGKRRKDSKELGEYRRVGGQRVRMRGDGVLIPERVGMDRAEEMREAGVKLNGSSRERPVSWGMRLTEKGSLVRREREYRMYIDYCHSDMSELALKELAVKWSCTEDEIRGVVSRVSSSRTLQLARLADGLRLMKCEEFLEDVAVVRGEIDKQLGELPEGGRVEVEYMDGAGKDGGGISRCQPVNRVRLDLMRGMIQLRKDEQEGLTGYLGKPAQKVEMDVKDATLKQPISAIDAEIEALEKKRVDVRGRVNVMNTEGTVQ